jgi:hypothetical protein
MKEKKNRLSKLSIVAFVIACFCLVSVTTQSSQAHTLGAASSTSFVGIVWSYFFPTTSNNSNSNSLSEEPVPMRTPDLGGTPDDLTTPTPTPCFNPVGGSGCDEV